MKNTEKKKTAAKQEVRSLIFTDLDGSLLDHYSYSFEPARSLLGVLEKDNIPVVCCSSKTFDEIICLRQSLENRHPFIVENGAAIYIPHEYFTNLEGYVNDDSCLQPNAKEGYDCISFCEPRSHWNTLVDSVGQEYSGQFKTFMQLGEEGISAATGLSIQEAVLANKRGFGEPVQWLGDELTEKRFVDDLHSLGVVVLKGGRFLHVSGAVDKGKALQSLLSIYHNYTVSPIESIAVGDGDNDIAMLEAADKALIIRSPSHAIPILQRENKVWISEEYGPSGWDQGIRSILDL